MTEEIEVDARGHRCPTPTLRLRRALAGARDGVCVRLLSDDPLARVDVPHFALEGGHAFLGEEALGDGAFAFRVRRGAPPPGPAQAPR